MGRPKHTPEQAAAARRRKRARERQRRRCVHADGLKAGLHEANMPRKNDQFYPAAFGPRVASVHWLLRRAQSERAVGQSSSIIRLEHVLLIFVLAAVGRGVGVSAKSAFMRGPARRPRRAGVWRRLLQGYTVLP